MNWKLIIPALFALVVLAGCGQEASTQNAPPEAGSMSKDENAQAGSGSNLVVNPDYKAGGGTTGK